MKVAVHLFSPRTIIYTYIPQLLHLLLILLHIFYKMVNIMSPILCLLLLCLCLCLNTSNARPLQGLEPENIGNLKQMTAIDNGQRIQEKYSMALWISWLNPGNYFALPSAKTKPETAQVTEYPRKQTRMLKESTMEKEKESVDPKEDDIGEDIVVMDYAQPHRKPPIHNMTP